MNLQDQYQLTKLLKDALEKANERINQLEEKVKKLENQKNDSISKHEPSLTFND